MSCAILIRNYRYYWLHIQWQNQQWKERKMKQRPIWDIQLFLPPGVCTQCCPVHLSFVEMKPFYMIIYLFQISQHNHFLNVLISLQMSRSFVNFAVHHIDINKQLLFIPRYANWSHVVINNHSFATTNCRNFLQGVSFLLKRNKHYFNLYARFARD